MRIEDPSYEILDRTKLSTTKRIEQAGRIAYKSEDKITDVSDIRFFQKMMEHKHYPVLEFDVLHFLFETPYPEDLSVDMGDFISLCLPMKYITFHMATSNKGAFAIISGTVRAFMEMLQIESTINSYLRYRIARYITDDKSIPLMFTENATRKHDQRFYELRRITGQQCLEILPPSEFDNHLMCAVKFIVNRAVTHELVRHRPCSFLQESQRYCRYDHDKFGNEVTFIKPVFWEEGTIEYSMWKYAMEETERLYLNLLETSSPQAARTVLPNSCKTEIIVYTTIAEWKHIFHLRDSSAAEPSMQQVMKPLHAEFFDLYNVDKWE